MLLIFADFDTKSAIISIVDALMLKLFYRQKVLLVLIQHFEGVLASTEFQKPQRRRLEASLLLTCPLLV